MDAVQTLWEGIFISLETHLSCPSFLSPSNSLKPQLTRPPNLQHTMAIISSLRPLSFLLATTLHSLPTIAVSNINNRDDNIMTEQWLIPRLDMHFMSSSTDEPGTASFLSSIDFDIVLPIRQGPFDSNKPSTSVSGPANKTITCTTMFASGTLPEEDMLCTGDGLGENEYVVFGMREFSELGARRVEISFVLEVWRVLMSGGDDGNSNIKTTTILNARRAITANDPHEPTSFLTCLQGAPGDGNRCRIKSYMSVSEELTLDAEGVVVREKEVLELGPDGAAGTFLNVAKRLERDMEEEKKVDVHVVEEEEVGVEVGEEIRNPIAPY